MDRAIAVKKILLNSFLSNMAIVARDRYRIISAALANPEELGPLTNRQLAYTLIINLCEPGNVFVDVGSHIGLFVSMLEKHDKTIKVIGIEAMPDKIVNLRRRFPHATFHECAAGESNGRATFNIYPDRDGYSSLLHFLEEDEETVIQISVSVRKLDDLVGSEKIGAIKLIIEGGELSAIKGSETILQENRPIVMFESGPFEDEASGNTIPNRWQIFVELDYSLFIPNRVAHAGPALSLEAFVDSHEYPRRTLYYFAIPNERRDEVMKKARQIQGIEI